MWLSSRRFLWRVRGAPARSLVPALVVCKPLHPPVPPPFHPSCSYTMFSDAPIEWDSSTPLDVILSDHLKAESPVSTTVDGRIANCAATPDAPLCAARAPAAESRGPARRLLRAA